jgi:hypothetical protein
VAKDHLDKFGLGLASVRFICGVAPTSLRRAPDPLLIVGLVQVRRASTRTSRRRSRSSTRPMTPSCTRGTRDMAQVFVFLHN